MLRKPIRTGAFSLFTSAALLGLYGCAKLDYEKVPTPTQYDNWTDADQKKADGMEGVRYYLPRPFVNLKQSTPVAQRAAFVSFHYDAGVKSYVLDLPVDAPTWLKKVAPAKLSVTQAFAATMAAPAASEKGTAQQKGTLDTSKGNSKATAPVQPKSGPDTPEPSTPPSTPSTLQAQTGYINETDDVTKLGDRFDVVYLPDFEEQYVIHASAGLGQIDITTKLRNGWAAETFSQKADNSTLIPYVIDQVSKSSEAAADIFTTWAPLAAGLPPGVTKLPGKIATSAAQLQKGDLGKDTSIDEAHAQMGDLLLFKIAEVKVAQPGLYPILKPREMGHWFKPGIENLTPTDGEGVLDQYLRQGKTPWIREDMAFIPCPPFTVVGFNTTTDVFMMPATQRVEQASEPAPPTGPIVDPTAVAAKAAIQTALKSDASKTAGKTELGEEFTKLNVDNSSNVDVASSGKDTLITLTLSKALEPDPGEDDDQETAKVSQWIGKALNLNDANTKATKTTFEKTSTGGFTAKIVVPVPLADLAKSATAKAAP